MGLWLFMFLFIFISCIVIDNWYDNQKQKIPLYFGVFIIFCAFVAWSVIDWKRHTLERYELTQSYLVLHYLTGKTEYISYQDIENVKFFIEGKIGRRCGLSFYIKGKDNIRTLSDFHCDDIKSLRNQINQKH